MTAPVGDDKGRSDVQASLSAGLRHLAASGFEVSEPGLSPIGASSDSPSVASHPLPPLTSPMLEANRRPPSMEGLVIADRIIAAAGHRTPANPVAVQAESDQTRVPANDHSGSDTTSTSRPNQTGDTTVLPRTAVISSPDGETFVLRDGESLTIGRVPGPGDLAVNHVEVSRLHVRLEMRLGQLLATDLGSTNGTVVVSGQSNTELKPQSAMALAEGDRLMVGADVSLCTVERIEWQS